MLFHFRGAQSIWRLLGDKPSAADNKPDNKLTADSKPAIAYFGAIIGSGVFFLSSGALLLHARRHGDRWHARIPVVWLDGLNTSAREAQLFQALMLLIFVAVPVIGIIDCMAVAEAGDICEQNTNNFYKGAETSLLWAPVVKEGKQMRLRRAGAGNEPCTSGIELFPRSWTPVGFYGFPVGAGCIAAIAIVMVFSRRKPSESGALDEAA